MDVKLISIIARRGRGVDRLDRPGACRGPLGRRRHGCDRPAAGSRGHDFAHALRRPRHDRDDGDLLPGRGTAAALRQSLRRLTMHFDWWTLALQTVNFAILVWLLQRFLYKPVLRMVDARRAEIDKAICRGRADDAQAKAQRARRHRGRTRRDRRRANARRCSRRRSTGRRRGEGAACARRARGGCAPRRRAQGTRRRARAGARRGAARRPRSRSRDRRAGCSPSCR